MLCHPALGGGSCAWNGPAFGASLGQCSHSGCSLFGYLFSIVVLLSGQLTHVDCLSFHELNKARIIKERT